MTSESNPLNFIEQLAVLQRDLLRGWGAGSDNASSEGVEPQELVSRIRTLLTFEGVAARRVVLFRVLASGQCVREAEAPATAFEMPWDGPRARKCIATALDQPSGQMDEDGETWMPVLVGPVCLGGLRIRHAVDHASAFAQTRLALDLLRPLVAWILSRGLNGQSEPDAAESLREERFVALGELSRGVAHSMNNVLGVILGYVELARIRIQDLDVEAAEYLSTALKTVDPVRTLTDGLLDFSGEELRVPDPGDARDALRSVRDLLVTTLPRHLYVNVNLHGPTPLVSLSDEMLRRAVLEASLAIAPLVKDGEALVLSATDELMHTYWGEGQRQRPGRYVRIVCAPESQQRQDTLGGHEAPPTTNAWGRMNARVQSAGGSVSWEQHDDLTRCVIRLPSELLVTAGDAVSMSTNETVNAKRDAPAPVRSNPPSDTSHAQALIIDDQPGVRRTARLFLESAGYRVAEAGTAEEGLVILRKSDHGVRVVFLDYSLPDATGSDVAWTIHDLPSSPAIILFTGMPKEARHARLPEGTEVLSKPYFGAEVVAAMKRALAR